MPVGSKEIIIHNGNAQDFIDPHVDGEKKKCGTIPRDWKKHPHGSLMHAKPFDLPLIPKSEWDDRLKDMVGRKALLSDLRGQGMNGKPIPSRDQNGKGYCWAHSSTSASMLVRAIMNEPYADLSAYMVACIIKNYQDEGGWGSESLEFIAEHGIPTSKYWPQQSMSRSNDTPEMRANAKLHRFTNWRDLDPSNMEAQVGTVLLMGQPGPFDYNWWSHSVCGADLVSSAGMFGVQRADSGKLMLLAEFEKVWSMNDPVFGGYGVRIWNSWGDSWSENGMGILTGSKAIPDSALCALVMTPSPA